MIASARPSVSRPHPRLARALRAPLRRGALLLALLAAARGGAAAQEPTIERTPMAPSPDDATGPRSVDGRVVRVGAHGPAPLPGAMVTLHRVGSDTAGPIDSMRTGRDGHYRFRFRPFGSPSALYFVSAMYDGIAYFTPPLRGAAVSGDDAEITVFDTTSGPVPLHVRGHHVIVAAADQQRQREVIEVFEISNDSTLTRLAGDTTPVFSAVLPDGATQFRVGEGDIAAQAVTNREGRVEVYAPFAPGLKQLSYSYLLPAKSFPLVLPVDRQTDVLEVLVEDPRAQVSGARLAAVNPVNVDGRSFSRFLGQEVPEASVARIDVPAPPKVSRTTYVYGVVVALIAAMLFALARAAFRRRPLVAVAPAEPPLLSDDPDVLARHIAAFDAAFERNPAPTDAERAEYEARRAELKARLAAALASARVRG